MRVWAFIILGVLIHFVSGYGDHRASRVLSSFSFSPPYAPAGAATLPGWEIRGHTSVTPDYIRLTPAEPKKSGFIINRRPFFLKSVELTLSFRIHSAKKLGSEGIALWMSDQPQKEGDVFGVSDVWKGVAVLLHSFDPDRPDAPQVQVHVNDGTKSYLNGDTLVASCAADYRNSLEPAHLHLFIENDTINVYIDPFGDNKWIRCMAGSPIVMPHRYFFSLSAATGHFGDNHDIISFSVNTMDEKLAVEKEMHKPPEEVLESENKSENEIEQHSEPLPKENTQSADVQELLEKIAYLENHNNNLALEIKQIQEAVARQQEQEASRQQEWDLKTASLKVVQEENLRVLEKRKEPGCSAIYTECSNLGGIRNSLVKSVAELQEGLGHELLELRYLFNDEAKRVESRLDPFGPQAVELGNLITHVSALVNQYGDTVSQISTSLKAKGTGEAFASQIRDATERVATLQASLSQIQLEQKLANDKVSATQMKLFAGSNGSFISFIVAILILIQILVLILQNCGGQKHKRLY